MTANGVTTTYLYGPDGARLKKQTGSATTLYLGGDLERDLLGGWTAYLTTDVKRVGGANAYLHRDHLASIRRVTDAARVDLPACPLLRGRPRPLPLTRLVGLNPSWRRNKPDSYSDSDPINKSDPNGHVYTEDATINSRTRVVTVNGQRVATGDQKAIEISAVQKNDELRTFSNTNIHAWLSGELFGAAIRDVENRDCLGAAIKYGLASAAFNMALGISVGSGERPENVMTMASS